MINIHLTVATIVQNQGRFLMVKENDQGRIVYNQPAGHLEHGESPVDGAIRETLEETAWQVGIDHLVGIYRWCPPDKPDHTYIRLCFAGHPQHHHQQRALDKKIIEALWLTPEQLAQLHPHHRSPMVMGCIRDYLAGKIYPLELLQDVFPEAGVLG